jgi:hypothetical protein
MNSAHACVGILIIREGSDLLTDHNMVHRVTRRRLPLSIEIPLEPQQTAMRAQHKCGTAAELSVPDAQDAVLVRLAKLRACRWTIGRAGPNTSAPIRPWTVNHALMTCRAEYDVKKRSLLELETRAVFAVLDFLAAEDAAQLTYTHLKFQTMERDLRRIRAIERNDRHAPSVKPAVVEKRYCRSSDITVVYSSLPHVSKAWPWFAMATVRDAALTNDDQPLTAYFIEGRDAEAPFVLEGKSTYVVEEATFRTSRESDAADKRVAALVRTLRFAPPTDAADLFWTLDTSAALAKLLQQWHATPRSMRDPALAGKMAVPCLDRGILSFPTEVHSMILDVLPHGDQEQLASMFEKCRLALRQLRGETPKAQEWRYCRETDTTVIYYRDPAAARPRKYFASGPVSVLGTSHVTLHAYFAEGRLLHDDLLRSGETRAAPLSPYKLTMRPTFVADVGDDFQQARKLNVFSREAVGDTRRKPGAYACRRTEQPAGCGSDVLDAIDAAVLEIMKSRKFISYVELQSLVVAQVSKQFMLRPMLIPQRVDALIDRGCLRRRQNDAKMLEYIPLFEVSSSKPRGRG